MINKIVKRALTLFLIIVTTASFAQENILQLEHQERGVTRTIKEHKRIRIKTIGGDKYKGRFTIIDSQTIAIQGVSIPISDIEKIKRDPLLLTALATSGFVYLGVIVVGVGAIVAIFVDGTSSIPFFAAGGGLGALGLLRPSYLPAKKIANGWKVSVKKHPKTVTAGI